MSASTAPIKLVDPPFYDAPIVDNEAGQQHSQAWTEYHQSVADQINSLAANTGVTDGSDAAAGQIGEYLTATASVALATSMAVANIVSINLTAGDWDVTGNCVFHAGSGTHSFFGCGIGGLDTYTAATFPTTALDMGINAALTRQSVTAATTVWLVAQAGFTGSVTAVGTIRARRVR